MDRASSRSRRGVGVGLASLVAGWLLGVGSAAAVPSLVEEQRTLIVSSMVEYEDFLLAVADGWQLKGAETVGRARVVILERPRVQMFRGALWR